jgi:filamentous hemagglutinin family protein
VLHTGRRIRIVQIVAVLPLVEIALVPAAFAAGVLTQGGQYVNGQGSITSSGPNLGVTQPGSARGVIDWHRFSIGHDSRVTFYNGPGATLNRVTGGSPSVILGELSATGSLYVINTQGILVGPSGVVSTRGRFVASTLDVCNCAFMKGDALTLSGDSNASVMNLGKISSSGGDVFLGRTRLFPARVIPLSNSPVQSLKTKFVQSPVNASSDRRIA